MRHLLDAELIRNCLLSANEGFKVFPTCKLESLEDTCEAFHVDVAVIDVRFPGRSAIDKGHQLLVDRLASRVLFIDQKHCSVRERLSYAEGATYCSRSIAVRDLVRVTLKLANKESLDSFDQKSLHIDQLTKRVDPSHASTVSKRETEIWTLLGEGYSITECAEILGIAESTADNHKSRLMKKLDVKKSVKLVRMAVRLGLVDP